MNATTRPVAHWICGSSLFASLVVCVAVASSALAATQRHTDTCDLLTADQLEQILGQPFEAPDRSIAPAAFAGEGAGTQCNYKMKSDHSRQVVFIEYIDASSVEARDAFERLSKWFPPTSQPFGVGDSAYMDDNRAIHVLQGRIRYYINIIPFGTASSEKTQQLRDLADWVAGQLRTGG
jgi:hypothetical protein